MNTDDTIVLRAAHKSEAGAIASMSRLQVEHGLRWRWTKDRVRRQIEEKETMVLVASVAGVVEGFSIMKFGDQEAHLLLLAVEPKLRRNGIGRAMMHWLEKSCSTAGVENVRLEVRKSNAAAIVFYQNLGYKIVGGMTDYYDGKEAAIVMTRSLTPFGNT